MAVETQQSVGELAGYCKVALERKADKAAVQAIADHIVGIEASLAAAHDQIAALEARVVALEAGQ